MRKHLLTKKQKEDLWEHFVQKTESGELEYIQPKDSQKYRKEFWLLQDKKCFVLGDEIDFKDCTLDHRHKLISDPVGVDGKGLVRAVLHRDVNGLEGKCYNYWNRTSLKNKYKLQDVLRKLASYYDAIENNELPIEQKFIYPSEKPEEPKELLTAAKYKKIKAYYFKIFPKRKKLPPKIKYLNDEYREYLKLIDEYRKKR